MGLGKEPLHLLYLASLSCLALLNAPRFTIICNPLIPDIIPTLLPVHEPGLGTFNTLRTELVNVETRPQILTSQLSYKVEKLYPPLSSPNRKIQVRTEVFNESLEPSKQSR